MQTAKGIEKRKPLEEAKPRSLVNKESARVDLRSAALEATRLNSFAYEYYSASNDAKNKWTHMPVFNCLTSILYHAREDPALDPAVLALSMRVVAMYRRDAMLLSRAKQRYTTALGALQTRLGSPETAMLDETLAVTVIMALYEVSILEQLALIDVT